MTGFAATPEATKQHESDKVARKMPLLQLQFELRSVNSRFLDLHFKLPESLRSHEAMLRQLIRQHLARGKVEIRARFSDTSEVTTPHKTLFDTRTLENVLQQSEKAQRVVQQRMPDAQPLRVADVLQLAHQLGSDQPRGESAPPTTHVQQAMQSALEALLTAREREGQALAQLMLKTVAALRQLAQQAQPLVPALVEQQRQRFLTRWNQALQSTDTPVPVSNASPIPATTATASQEAQERALSEATAYALRIDVTEELDRLQLHLNEIEHILRTGAASTQLAQPGADKPNPGQTTQTSRMPGVGKRLEFLIQELHREANTLGSKSSTAALSGIGVDMKVLIEQLREQVQNIE